MSTLRASNIYDKDGTSNAVLYGVASPTGSMGFRNRILNGGMVIDQRNAGASVSATAGVYTLDRWNAYASQNSKFTVQQNAGSVTPPAGFTHYLGVTSSSAYSVGASEAFLIRQYIEGFNFADLDFGKATAKTVTLSFWVRSSLTGTFGGALQNRDANRCYPFSYTISAANTWEQKTVTIAGDTSGTWQTNNDTGARLQFGLGVGSTYSGTAGAWTASEIYSVTGAVSVVGTNGATFYITGVQLEAGSVASPFERRDYGRELMMCQRYFQTYSQPPLRGAISSASSVGRAAMILPVVMRAAPTATVGALPVYDGGSTSTVSSVASSYLSSTQVEFDLNLSTSVMTLGRAAIIYQNGSSTMTLSAEL